MRHKVTTSAMQIGVLALTVAMHFYSACARARERFEGGVTGGRQLDYARVQESSCCSYTFVMSGGVRLQTVKNWAKEVDIVGEWLRYDETSGFVTRVHCELCNNANQKSTTAIQVHGCIAVAAMQFLRSKLYPECTCSTSSVMYTYNVHAQIKIVYQGVLDCCG